MKKLTSSEIKGIIIFLEHTKLTNELCNATRSTLRAMVKDGLITIDTRNYLVCKMHSIALTKGYWYYSRHVTGIRAYNNSKYKKRYKVMK